MSAGFSFLDHLKCARCAKPVAPHERQAVCECGGPLFCRYALDAVRERLTRAEVAARPPDLWRYHELLPVRKEAHALSLGEGFTPLLPSRRLGAALGVEHLFFKVESGNPTGSFKARGMAVAVARARELGAKAVALPSAGNAGSAAACYAALHGLAASVWLPRSASRLFADEARAYGASVESVEGTIADAAARMAKKVPPECHDLSTLKEPYRLEGKKTMGFELLEQLEGRLPDVIIVPTGGGTGILGLWKSFGELQGLGWWSGLCPRMVAVQAEGCHPVVKAWREGRTGVDPWPDPATFAEGLCVPRPYADREILGVLRDSGGSALAVGDDEIRVALRRLAREEGILTSPEGGAAVAAAERLARRGQIPAGAVVVALLTGSAHKHPSVITELPAGR